MVKVNCLFCEKEISVSSRVRIADLISCSNCKTMFRVVWLYPVEIDWLDMNESPKDAAAKHAADVEAGSLGESSFDPSQKEEE